jgi:hypothetical protein
MRIAYLRSPKMRVPVAGKGEIDDRLSVGLDLGDDRFVDFVRQLVAHARHPVAHVVGRHVDFAGDAEAQRDLAAFRPADRRHDIDTLDAGQAFLKRLGDLAFDDVGRRAAIIGRDRDHRFVDIGIFADGQTLVRDDADQDQGQAHHRRQDRPADADVGQAHGFSSPRRRSAP